MKWSEVSWKKLKILASSFVYQYTNKYYNYCLLVSKQTKKTSASDHTIQCNLPPNYRIHRV